MEPKHPESFVSIVHHIRPTLGAVEDNSTRSARREHEIRTELTKAQELYQAEKYMEAISAYNRARALIYQSLHPSFNPSDDIARKTVFPVSQETETNLAEAGLRLAESLKTGITISRSPIQVPDVEVPESITRFDRLGLTDTDIGTDVQAEVEIGIAHLARKEPAAAIEAFSSALQSLETFSTPESRDIRASIELNLSSAYILDGNQDEAIRYAAKAQETFEAAEDEIGTAQASHNIAVANHLAGRTEDATEAFETAKTRYESVASEWRGRSGDLIPESEVRLGNSVLGNRNRHLNWLDASHFEQLISIGYPDGRIAFPDGGNAVVNPSPRILSSGTDLQNLDYISRGDRDTLAIRWPEKGGGWSGVPVTTPQEDLRRTASWTLGTLAGDEVVTVDWTDGQRPAAGTLLEKVYQPRVNAASLESLRWQLSYPGDTAAYLPHLYSFVIPVGLGDCHHEIGEYARAEQYYLQSTSYSYVNRMYEAPALWAKIAKNIVAWGDAQYRNEEIEACMETYAKLITREGTVPEDAPLFSRTVFEDVATEAREIIETARTLSELEPDAEELMDANPDMAAAILTAWSRWQYLLAGLDFYGLTLTPIFTFDYLQEMARGFAQQAVTAEREFVNFRSQAEAEEATRRELESAREMAKSEVDIRWQQYGAAQRDERAAKQAVEMAKTRVESATRDMERYEESGWHEHVGRAYGTEGFMLSPGTDPKELRELVAQIERGERPPTGSITDINNILNSDAWLAQAHAFLANTKSYEYQLGRHESNVSDMEAAIPVAEAQEQAANWRKKAARLSWEASQQRAKFTSDALAAFENELFTPELWNKMSLVMRMIANDYIASAIQMAKLMERAYNFEMDDEISLIRNEYTPGFTEGLLGADMLLRDIDAFTVRRVTETKGKETRVKDVISLASEYPLQFYDFQQTGQLEVETALHDFDRRHPGLYGQRLSAVEVEIVGLLPPQGITGTLRGGIVSRYRTAGDDEQVRIHGVDTMALSEYELRDDSYLFRTDSRIKGLFEGHGVATSWKLSLPRRSNDLDYSRIVDVRLVLYYTARYSQQLESAILEREPAPGELVNVRDFAVRYDYPASWYTFLDEGELVYEVARGDLPYTETNFHIDGVAIRLIGSDGVDVHEGVSVEVALPGKAPVTLTTDENGEVTSDAPEFADSLGGQMIGEWELTITPPADSPLADEDGVLRTEALENVLVIVEYGYDWQE